MKSKTNLWVLLGVIGLGLGSSACSAGVDATDPGAEAAPGTVEQKYTPVGRLVYYEQPVTIGSIGWWGGGDTDVYTQKNRTYPIYASAQAPWQEPGKVNTRVVYDVQENYPDYTHLHGERDVTFLIPPTLRVNLVLSTASNFDLTRTCYYDHCWYSTDISAPWYDSYGLVRKVTYWFDGNGPDDNGNARANFVIGLWLDVTDI